MIRERLSKSVLVSDAVWAVNERSKRFKSEARQKKSDHKSEGMGGGPVRM